MNGELNVNPGDSAAIFDPQWSNEDRDDGFAFFEHPENRTPHPNSTPAEALDAVAYTYTAHYHIPAAETFHQFPRFPVELRRMIWMFSLPEPRVVEVVYDTRYGCRSLCAPPTALSVNLESRQVALARFKLCFGTNEWPPMVYFDMDHDQLYLGVGNFHFPGFPDDPAGLFVEEIGDEDKKRLKHLAIDHSIDYGYVDPLTHNNQPEIRIYDSYRLVNLATMTSVLTDVDGDVFFTHAEAQAGELHPWQVDELGQVAPWALPRPGVRTQFEVIASAIWANLELSMQAEGHRFDLPLYRLVSRSRLRRDPRWKARLEFLTNFTAPFAQSCLYVRDGIAERLVPMEDLEPQKFLRLCRILSKQVQGNAPGSRLLDAQDVYSAVVPCSCRTNHRVVHITDSIEGMDLSHVDYEAAMLELFFDEVVDDLSMRKSE